MQRRFGSRSATRVLGIFLALVSVLHAQPIIVNKLVLPQGASDMVWDGTRSRFFASSGTNVLMINPETAEIEDTIPIDGAATKIALSDDGQFLYVATGRATSPYDSLGIIDRYRIQGHQLDLKITLGLAAGGGSQRDAQAMVVLPGQPSSILVATTDRQLIVFDNALPRSGKTALSVRSLYIRPSDKQIFAIGAVDGRVSAQVIWLSVSAAGAAASRSVSLDPSWQDSAVTWNGNFLVSNNTNDPSIFDLNSGTITGRVPITQSRYGDAGACILSSDPSDSSAFIFQYASANSSSTANLIQYSLV